MTRTVLPVVEPLQAADIDDVLALARASFTRRFARVPGEDLPAIEATARAFIRSRIEASSAVGARDGAGSLVGYAAYDRFDFHGDRAAFCPTLGTASIETAAADIYECLYTNLAARWVADGTRKHIVMVPATDDAVATRLVEIGFGRYVVDTAMPLGPEAGLSSIVTGSLPARVLVRQAGPTDQQAIYDLSVAAVRWYSQSPTFLAMEAFDRDELAEQLSNEDWAIFVAERADTMLGYMGIHRIGRLQTMALIGSQWASLDGVGAYIEPGSRNVGIGAHLLHACRNWAIGKRFLGVHVDFESANPAARRFWLRYFCPRVISFMRTCHSDAPTM